MKKTKSIIAVLSAATLLLSFVACSSPSGGGSGSQNEPKEENNSSENRVKIAVFEDTKNKEKITFYKDSSWLRTTTDVQQKTGTVSFYGKGTFEIVSGDLKNGYVTFHLTHGSLPEKQKYGMFTIINPMTLTTYDYENLMTKNEKDYENVTIKEGVFTFTPTFADRKYKNIPLNLEETNEQTESSDEDIDNDALVMEEIKAITESTSYVLSKSCKLSTVKEALDYLKENKPEVEIDLDLTKYPTTVIDDNAFANSTNIKSVRFPDNLASIGDLAFADCSNLISIEIPASVKRISKKSFKDCTNLSSIYYNGSLSLWCENPYTSYESYTSPDTKTWDASVFPSAYDLYLNNNKVTELTEEMLQDIRSFRDYAFKNCKSLISVSIPLEIKNFGRNVFVGCSGITTVTANQVMLGNFSDFDSNSIKEIIVQDGVTELPSYSFAYCSNLTSVTIPASVTKIESYIFKGCESITNIIFEDTTSKWYWGETEEGVPMSKDSAENAKLFKSKWYSVLLSEKYISN